jgi:hypothetical protein
MKTFIDIVNESTTKIGKYDINDLLSKGLESSNWGKKVSSWHLSNYTKAGKFYGQDQEGSAKILKVTGTTVGIQVISSNSTISVDLFNLEANPPETIGHSSYTIKTFFDIFSKYIQAPLTIGGKPITKFSHLEKNDNNLDFVMQNGTRVSVWLGQSLTPESVKDINDKIEELTDKGFTIPKSVLKQLEVMFPELYGDVDFTMSSKIIPALAREFAKTDPVFAKFILKTDTETRMSHGIAISSDSVKVFDWIGNTSSDYRSKTLKLTKTPKNVKELATIIKKSDLIPFIMDVIKRHAGNSAGFADYVKRTGGHAGNPVWMD